MRNKLLSMIITIMILIKFLLIILMTRRTPYPLILIEKILPRSPQTTCKFLSLSDWNVSKCRFGSKSTPAGKPGTGYSLPAKKAENHMYRNLLFTEMMIIEIITIYFNVAVFSLN